MPDHVHILAIVPELLEISRLIGRFKRSVSHSCQVNWQRDGFDHRIRNSSQMSEVAEYIRSNPVRAKLVQLPNEWPYVRSW